MVKLPETKAPVAVLRPDAAAFRGIKAKLWDIRMKNSDPFRMIQIWEWAAAIAGLKHGEIVVDLGSGGGLDCLLAVKKVGHTGRSSVWI
jgi:hypothetical protein